MYLKKKISLLENILKTFFLDFFLVYIGSRTSQSAVSNRCIYENTRTPNTTNSIHAKIHEYVLVHVLLLCCLFHIGFVQRTHMEGIVRAFVCFFVLIHNVNILGIYISIDAPTHRNGMTKITLRH